MQLSSYDDSYPIQLIMVSDLSRQYASSLSILAVALFVGVPIWWKTTEVYRCALPYRKIERLRDKHVRKVQISLVNGYHTPR